jgi:uncharacterized protein with PIN domain
MIIDTSAVLAILLDESEKLAIAYAKPLAHARTSVTHKINRATTVRE